MLDQSTEASVKAQVPTVTFGFHGWNGSATDRSTYRAMAHHFTARALPFPLRVV